MLVSHWLMTACYLQPHPIFHRWRAFTTVFLEDSLGTYMYAIHAVQYAGSCQGNNAIIIEKYYCYNHCNNKVSIRTSHRRNVWLFRLCDVYTHNIL